MYPQRLSIKGLYSYKEERHIDFETLTVSGLFGIFGGVGSGKSSILEAIIFVLYGQSERLKRSGENRYYNMLNLQSDVLAINFEFKVGQEEYKAYFRARRNSKNPEDVKSTDHTFYQKKEEDWLPLEVTDATSLLGMDYDNFRLAVIIPQGKFKAFIDKSSTDRTRMLKELFGLGKYELFYPASRLASQTKEDFDKVQGALQQLGEVDKEQLAEHKTQLKSFEEKLAKASKEKEGLEKEERTLSELKSLFEQLEQSKVAFEQKNAQKEAFDQRKQVLARFEQATNQFGHRLKQLEELKKEALSKHQEHLEINASLTKATAQLKGAEERFAQAQKNREANEERYKQILEDIELLISLKEVDEKANGLKKRIANGTPMIEQSKAVLEQSQKELSKKEQEVLKQNTAVSMAGTLHQVNAWHQEKARLMKEQEKLGALVKNYQQQREEILKSQKEELKAHSAFEKVNSFEHFFELLAEERKQIKAKNKSLEEERQKLLVREQLGGHQLEDGKPCPLCGALEHPNPAELTEVKEELKALAQKLKNLELQSEQLEVLEGNQRKLDTSYQHLIQQVAEKNTELDEKVEALKAHADQFIWEAFKSEDHQVILQKLQEIQQVQQQLESLQKEITGLKEAIQSEEGKLKKMELGIQQLQQEQSGVSAEKETLLKRLKSLAYEKEGQDSLDRLAERRDKGEKAIRDLLKAFEEASQAREKWLGETTLLKGKAQGAEKATKEAEQRKGKAQEEIGRLVEESAFETLEEVQQVLGAQINIEQERVAVEAFYKELHASEQSLSAWQAKTKGKTYLAEEHQALLEKLQGMIEAISKEQQERAVLQERVERMEDALKKQRELKKESKRLELRLANLETLKKLFKGSGFVQYVSTVYLQNLCAVANTRFSKLTQNTLNLELNAENEFVVRDYLNEGKVRLLKTLSGGQQFQASLCLALALSENVRTLNQSDKSFFFIDEGFGSLDSKSLEVVFDALNSLRKENRIVGIISHVEELKQDIDMFLEVENHKEKGSVLKESWEV